MLIHVDNCPRCKAKQTTFDVCTVEFTDESAGIKNVFYYEVPMQCRNCRRLSIVRAYTYDEGVVRNLELRIAQANLLKDILKVSNFITLADIQVSPPPEHLPQNVHNAFIEGAKCYAAGCYNAAGAMFRLSLDLASKSQLPNEDTLTTHRQKTYLADRLEWLFDNKHWPASLKDMVTCIRQDGNDGAHDGELGEDEAYDIMDFSFMVLEKIYTEPERIRISQERRASRNKNK
ncbi:DUF4145 domain-containing protein [Shewanella xiamenensis]|uniref:DUF4145 domain-containing protein n=1 Tax=Shewanella xiamenensis TaxID=332186 RepID=UPI001F0513A6|nr:DUF4145 domain-containing protein [Shewanella xiamenensis]UML94856.1 DUF4145 domain-containing protein [Shewanella xiamenensis]